MGIHHLLPMLKPLCVAAKGSLWKYQFHRGPPQQVNSWHSWLYSTTCSHLQYKRYADRGRDVLCPTHAWLLELLRETTAARVKVKAAQNQTSFREPPFSVFALISASAPGLIRPSVSRCCADFPTLVCPHWQHLCHPSGNLLLNRDQQS